VAAADRVAVTGTVTVRTVTWPEASVVLVVTVRCHVAETLRLTGCPAAAGTVAYQHEAPGG
jgi:hypothetical protein